MSPSASRPLEQLQGARVLDGPRDRALQRPPVRKAPGYTETKAARRILSGMPYATVQDIAASWERYARFAPDADLSGGAG